MGVTSSRPTALSVQCGLLNRCTNRDNSAINHQCNKCILTLSACIFHFIYFESGNVAHINKHKRTDNKRIEKHTHKSDTETHRQEEHNCVF